MKKRKLNNKIYHEYYTRRNQEKGTLNGFNIDNWEEIPEINPNGNAHDQIQANIYQAILEGLHEYIAEKDSEND